jgi:hypothetical protein
MKLKQNCEVIGTLSHVEKEGNQLKLLISMIKEIEVPKAEFTPEHLEKFLGKRVGILNVSGSYKIRQISTCMIKGGGN